MIKGFQLGDYQVRLPIVQGGMGVGISLSGLAGAVAAAGGVGLISTAQIGFREADFDTDPQGANLRAMETELKRAREIAPNGVIGYNIMMATRNYADYVTQAIRCGADVIVTGAGLPVDLPAICKKAEEQFPGRHTALAPIVSSKKAASLICRLWEKRHHRLPDMVVVEGPQAGGHLGFTKEEAENWKTGDYDSEIRAIQEEIRSIEERTGKKIPVVVGGGISCREQAKHVLEKLGASAIQVATRFVTTKECDAPDAYKEAYVNATEEDVRIIKSPVGMPGRAIYNEFLKKVESGVKEPIRLCHRCLEKCKPAEIPYCITDALVHAARGEMDEALIFCGAQVERCHTIETVPQVIGELLGLDESI